jgi:hypothetical protein
MPEGAVAVAVAVAVLIDIGQLVICNLVISINKEAGGRSRR